MASVDGSWNCTASTPMGEQAFTLDVTSSGDRFSGRVAGAIGSKAIEDGTVSGDTLAWTMDVPVPFPVTLDCTATVTGDRLEGSVRAGGFGSFPLAGTRAG
jgi:hypothetical protein